MENFQRVNELSQHKINGQGAAEMALRPSATVDQRRQPQVISPVAVSQSSYLNEKDRHFRAAETVENGADLAKRAAHRVLELDDQLREAQSDGATPRALAIIERLEEAYGQTAGMLVFDFMGNPYERW